MRKRGFLSRLISILPTVMAIVAVCVCMYLWHTAGLPHVRNRTVAVSFHPAQTDPAIFHACVPNLLARVCADLKLNPRNIRSPRRDRPDPSGRSTHTILIPLGESFFRLHMELAEAARDSGGMVFDAIENMEGDQLTISIGAAGRMTDTVVLKRSAERKKPGVRTAIVIVDAGGRDISDLKGLCMMGVKVTLAIKPSSRYASAAAKLAKDTGMPHILYLPSKLGGTKAQDAESIVPSEPDETIKKKLTENFDTLPGAEGVMFSVESRSDEDVRGLETILETLRNTHRYYVDVLPLAQSPGCAIGGRRWVKVAGTEGLVDGVFASTQGRAGLRALIMAASEHMPSVVACASDPTVIGLLVRELPVLKSSGIQFVGAGEATR